MACAGFAWKEDFEAEEIGKSFPPVNRLADFSDLTVTDVIGVTIVIDVIGMEPAGSHPLQPGPSRQPEDFILKAKADNDSKTKRRAKGEQQVHTCCD